MADEAKLDTKTPAHVPYATLISSLESLKKNGIPSTGKIDKTLFDSYAGSVQVQLLASYKFLGFMDADNMVLQLLPQIVAADPETRRAVLRKLIEEKYARIIALDLRTISPGQLDEAFRAFGISGSTLTRCERFFVKACTELGIPISPRVSGKTRTVGPRTARRPRNGAGSRQPEDSSSGGESSQPQQSRLATWEDRLLEKFPAFDPTWPDELKAKWFEGFERFMGAKDRL